MFTDYDEMQAYITKVEQYYPKSHGKYDRYVDYSVIDFTRPIYPNRLCTVLMSLDRDDPVTKEEIEWEYDGQYEEPVISYVHSYMREPYHVRVQGYDSIDILLECAQQERQRLLSRVYCPLPEAPPHDIMSLLDDQRLLKCTGTTCFYHLPSEVWHNTDHEAPVVCKVDDCDHITTVKVVRMLDTEYFYSCLVDYVSYSTTDVVFWGIISSRNDAILQPLRNPAKTLCLTDHARL